jgi:hypothetical protein
MPITATPASPRMLTLTRIRMAMRDVAGQIPNTGDYNVLLADVQFSDDEINNAIQFTVESYNSITPITNIRQDQVNNYILYLGVVAFLCQSEQIKELRNDMDLVDGNVAPIGKDKKHQLYGQLAQVALQKFEERAKSYKIQLNMQSAYGGLGSGYANVARVQR